MAIEQLTFTVVEGGRGFDPSVPTGYQIKACSPGLRDDDVLRDRVAGICTHYGQTVYDPVSAAVSKAREKESAWCFQQQTLPDTVARHVLDEFPVIWSYTRVGDDLYALTRTCYTGFCPDGRPGNYFAHALVFPPQELAGHDYNPLALSRGGPFQSQDTGGSTELRSLPNPGPPPGEKTDLSILGRGPWRSRLNELVTVLSRARSSHRPLLLCIEDWRQAGPLIEACLALLPPSARCRTTFCTFENDRYWVPTEGGARPAGSIAAHRLLTLCGPDDSAWSLYPDDYHSKYAVFNFVGDQFSELPGPTGFAEFAAACIDPSRLPRLERYHELLERLNVGQDPNAWDALLPAPALLDAQSPPGNLAAATRALAEVAVEPHQARAAIDMVLPWLDRLAAAGDHENLRAFGSCLRELSPRGDASSGQRIVEAVRPPAARALVAGRGQTLASLLGSCGPERENVLLDQLRALLCEQNATWTAAAEPVDRQVLSELLLEALAAAGAQPDRAPPKSQLLIAAFQAATEASRTAEVWALLADTEIKAQLGRKWDAQQQQLASTLETHVPPAACPEASAWLNMELARTAQQGDEVLRRLTRLAAAHARLPENARKTKQLFKLTGDLLTDPLHRAVAFGRMAEAAAGSALGDRLYGDFQEAIEPLKPEQCDKAHRGLARAGAVNVLCRAIVADVLPWDQESHKRFQRWSKVVLESSPAVVDCLCSRLVDLLDQEDRAEQVFPVARQLMAKPAASGDAAAMRRLYDKVLLTMPLEPLSEKWNRVFSMLPEGLDAVARNRLQVFRFMREVQTLAGQPDWSIARFPDDKPAWRELDRLPPPEPWQVVTWCVDRLKGLQNAGIETSNDARTFVEKFRAAKMESPQHLAAAVVRLTGDCDPVSRVLVATTFACCGLEGAAGFRGWRDLVVAIADRLDPATRDLFELHLRYRFRRPDPELRNRLHNLYVALGMEQPETPAEAAAPPPDAGQADHPTEGIVRSVLHFFRGRPSDK